jgi:hypothetical protein
MLAWRQCIVKLELLFLCTALAFLSALGLAFGSALGFHAPAFSAAPAARVSVPCCHACTALFTLCRLVLRPSQQLAKSARPIPVPPLFGDPAPGRQCAGLCCICVLLWVYTHAGQPPQPLRFRSSVRPFTLLILLAGPSTFGPPPISPALQRLGPLPSAPPFNARGDVDRNHDRNLTRCRGA